MVKRSGCVSHFLRSETQRKRKAICSLSLPAGEQATPNSAPKEPPLRMLLELGIAVIVAVGTAKWQYRGRGW